MWPAPRPRSASPAAAASRCAPRAPSSLARSCAPLAPDKCPSIPSRSFRTRSSGVPRSGARTIATRTAWKPMTPAPRRARPRAPRTSPFRDTSSLPPRVAIPMPWRLSSARTRCPPSAAASATAVARMPAPAVAWTRRSPSTRSRSSSPSATWMRIPATFRSW